MTRTKLVLILGLAYLLRAESSLPDAPPDHQKPAGGGLIDGTSGKPREDTSSSISSSSSSNNVGSKPRTTPTSMSAGSKTHFADEGSENVTGLVGQPAVLLCRVKNLGNRTVSWIRKRDLHILTSMALTYTSDERFSVIGNTETSDDWNLRIDYVQPRDEGIYECQVNTEPKIHRAVYLRVLDVQAEIAGPEDVYVRKGSTISLICMVNSQGVPPSNVTWYHAGSVIDFDGPRYAFRGGVSLETEKSKGGTTSKLLITRASIADSGNYSCVSSKAARDTVVVHVLNGEHPAAMQHGTAVSGSTPRLLLLLLLLLLLALMSR